MKESEWEAEGKGKDGWGADWETDGDALLMNKANAPLCLRKRPQWKLHFSFRTQLPLTLTLYSAPHRQHILLNAAEEQITFILLLTWIHSLTAIKGEAGASLTVCDALLLGLVVNDGLAGGLGVRPRVSVLLELLLCHQVRLHLPVQCGSCRETHTPKWRLCTDAENSGRRLQSSNATAILLEMSSDDLRLHLMIISTTADSIELPTAL